MTRTCRRRFCRVGGIVLGVVLFLIPPFPALRAQGQVPAGQPGGRVDVLITFRGVPGPAEEALMRSVGSRISRRFHLVPVVAANLPVQALSALLAEPRVTTVEPDGLVFALDGELDAAWGVGRIGAGTPQAEGIRGAGVRVAVIDTGIDYVHPDLAPNFAGGFDFVNNDADPWDDHGHGTHVAGTIGARDNDLGVVGVAPDVQLYGLKVLDANGSGSFSNVIAALEWAVDHGVQITNNSYGTSTDPGSAVEAAFANAEAAGVLHVAAAGNSGNCWGLSDTVGWPARYGSVIAVAATDQYDLRACFSAHGPALELAAPGVAINSTVPGGGYTQYSGTSMASPHVAGTAALVMSAGPTDENANGRVNDDVGVMLTSTVQDLGDPGWDELYGFGLVDAAAAVAAVLSPGSKVILSLLTDKTTYTNGADTAAQLTAGIEDENGIATTGLDASAFVTKLDGMPAAVTFSATATPGVYAGALDVSTLATGTHTVVVTATDARGISGSDAVSFTVSNPDPPDLVVSALTAPSRAVAGEAIIVDETTRNSWSGDSPSSTTTFYLSSDFVVDPSDDVLGQRSVPALAAGTDSAASTSVTIRADTPGGAFYLIAHADAAGQVAEASEANNIRGVYVQIGADLVLSTLTGPAGAAAGATISTTDTVVNEGAGAAGASTTRFYLSKNGLLDAADVLLAGGRSVPPLAPGASSSGSAMLAIPDATTPGPYYVIAKADGDEAVPETQESNNTRFAALEIGPDLIISALSAPTVAGPGASIAVSDSVKNRGSGPVGSTTVRFYLSTNATVEAGDVVLGQRAAAALASGATSSGSTMVMIPAGTSPGAYFLIAVADADQAAAEAYENNNASAATLQVGTDLVVATLSAPATSGAGAAIVVTEATRNQGSGTADASTTRFYLSANAALDASDVPLGSRAVPALPAGTSSSASSTLTIPAGTTAGAYYLIARADADDALIETQEGNNTKFVSLQIGPDLVVSTLTPPPVAGAGSTISVSVTTRNQGGGPSNPSATRFYLSSNAVLDAADVLLTGEWIVPALAAGQSDAASVSVTIPSSTATAAYFLIARADSGEAVAETQEGNNTLYAYIQVGTDLTVSGLTAPATGGAGATLQVTDTTKNQGGGPAAASTTRFFLSVNFLLDASDVRLDGARTVPALEAGQWSSGSTMVTIPASTSTGGYFLIAVADADSAIVETQETNNTRYVSVQIGPDLAVKTLSIPASAPAGSSIVVSETIKNQGGGAAGASIVRVYLSKNFALDATDTLLDGSRAIGDLAAGQESAGSTPVTIPASTPPGDYFIIAAADANATVAETQEWNNTLYAYIRIAAP